MGFSGIWLVVALSDAEIARISPDFRARVEAAEAEPETLRRWDRWVSAPEEVRGVRPVPGVPNRLDFNEASLDFLMMFTHPLEESDLMRTWHAIAEPEPIMFLMTRKCFAVTALFHGIGPRRAKMLPGFQGNFLLRPDRVRAALPAVEAALTFDDAGRKVAEERISDWLTTAGDSHDNPTEIVDGFMRIFSEAARRDLGLCGVTVHDSCL